MVCDRGLRDKDLIPQCDRCSSVDIGLWRAIYTDKYIFWIRFLKIFLFSFFLRLCILHVLCVSSSDQVPEFVVQIRGCLSRLCVLGCNLNLLIKIDYFHSFITAVRVIAGRAQLF